MPINVKKIPSSVTDKVYDIRHSKAEFEDYLF